MSRFLSTRTLPSSTQDETRVGINIDGRDAVLRFPNTCITGEFRKFSPLLAVANDEKEMPQDKEYGWSSEDGKCSIHVMKGDMSASQYSDIVRNIHYYLIEIGPGGALKTFPF